MNASPPRGEDKPRLYLFLAVLVLLLAAALRIVAIRDAPPGPRFDETFDALMARRIVNGERPIYFPENFGEEALNQYVQAAAFAAFGWSDLALRWPSFAFGMIEVAAVYALGRRAWNRRAGLLAAALCAASFWSVFYARLGLRLTALTALASLGVLMLFKMQEARRKATAQSVIACDPSASLRAGAKQSPYVTEEITSSQKSLLAMTRAEQSQHKKKWMWAAAAGVLFGLSVHTYTAARALPILLIGAVAYLALRKTNRAEFRRQVGYWVLVIVIAALIAAPLVYYLATQPQAEARVEQVSGPLDALRQGDAMPLVRYALAAFGMFGVRGGDEWLYNLPGRPIFDPVMAVVFLVGLVVALRQWRTSRTAFVLIWLIAGLAPSLLSWPPASASHAILAQPAVYLLAGLGLDATLSFIVTAISLLGGLGVRGERLKSLLPGVLVLAILALNVTLTSHDYFGVWTRSDPVRWEHQATVTEMGRYVDTHPELRDVAFMGNAVDYHSPWMKVGNSLTSRRTDARWFNPARALVWDPSGPMTYLLPFRDPNPVTFNQIVSDAFYGAVTQTLDEKLPDGRPVFTAFAMANAAALEAQATASGIRPSDFDGRWTLIGYEARPPQARPGDVIRVLTFWRVARVDASPLVMFTHLLGPDGKLVAQEDRLDVAPETLHAGDEFLQTQRVTLPGDAQPGTYQIAIGLYSPVTLARVPVSGTDRVEFSLVVR